MKVLLLNGSRLPGGCLNSQASTLIRNFRLEFPDNALTENESDCLIDSSLSELFSSGEHYDLVILPYSLSPSPADRYSGVRCAAHIRLTPEWRHQQVQILFFGNEDAFAVGRRSMLGTILLTPGERKTVIFPFNIPGKSRNEAFQSLEFWMWKKAGERRVVIESITLHSDNPESEASPW